MAGTTWHRAPVDVATHRDGVDMVVGDGSFTLATDQITDSTAFARKCPEGGGVIDASHRASRKA